MDSAATKTSEGGPDTPAAAYLRLYDRLRAWAARRIADPDAAEDIVQAAYLRLAGRPGGADERMIQSEAFVYRIVGNLARDHRRDAARRGWDGDAALAGFPDATPSAERRVIDQARLRRALDLAATLPPRCREVFVLRKIEGLDQATIAERLGISRNMVEKHLRRALAEISAGLDAVD
ncbi:hypothetical protein BZG35_08355 [Brevundimonas sp. LM2]|uniref:RNA polymerase sigma factor n=1 Tax=Brevundimonas sp. LM2 TaxID=1938605 RepID=UPI000983AB21|nr:RNA polymerase sigma factor [Brevundimonas sp. LM2]AQR61661.1 hypothetical protein BZG35_08355 [Brevundimonas sp. LM2]